MESVVEHIIIVTIQKICQILEGDLSVFNLSFFELGKEPRIVTVTLLYLYLFQCATKLSFVLCTVAGLFLEGDWILVSVQVP